MVTAVRAWTALARRVLRRELAEFLPADIRLGILDAVLRIRGGGFHLGPHIGGQVRPGRRYPLAFAVAARPGRRATLAASACGCAAEVPVRSAGEGGSVAAGDSGAASCACAGLDDVVKERIERRARLGCHARPGRRKLHGSYS